jgi:hypothetical protein
MTLIPAGIGRCWLVAIAFIVWPGGGTHALAQPPESDERAAVEAALFRTGVTGPLGPRCDRRVEPGGP